MTLSLSVYGMIRKHLKSTNSVNLYYHLKYIKTECTLEDIIYKMFNFEERRGKQLHLESQSPKNEGSILIKYYYFCKQAKVHEVGILLYCYFTSGLTSSDAISVLIVLLPDLTVKGSHGSHFLTSSSTRLLDGRKIQLQPCLC